MNATDHNRWKEDLAAYMLGALEPDEAAELERHLEGCERCRAEMTLAGAGAPDAAGGGRAAGAAARSCARR